MCLQDQRMAAFGSLRTLTLNNGLGTQTLPDVSRALWFQVCDNTGNPVVVYFKDLANPANALPRDAERIGPLGTPITYTREQCGSLFLGPLVYAGGVAGGLFATVFEMDADTYTAVQQPLGA